MLNIQYKRMLTIFMTLFVFEIQAQIDNVNQQPLKYHANYEQFYSASGDDADLFALNFPRETEIIQTESVSLHSRHEISWNVDSVKFYTESFSNAVSGKGFSKDPIHHDREFVQQNKNVELYNLREKKKLSVWEEYDYMWDVHDKQYDASTKKKQRFEALQYNLDPLGVCPEAWIDIIKPSNVHIETPCKLYKNIENKVFQKSDRSLEVKFELRLPGENNFSIKKYRCYFYELASPAMNRELEGFPELQQKMMEMMEQTKGLLKGSGSCIAFIEGIPFALAHDLDSLDRLVEMHGGKGESLIRTVIRQLDFEPEYSEEAFSWDANAMCPIETNKSKGWQKCS